MSEVSDLSEVVDDGTLSEVYVIQRSVGQLQPGGWVTAVTNLPGWGVVSTAREEELKMLPEGDRVTGAMVFHSMERIYETQLDGVLVGNPQQRVSDKMIWYDQVWRVLAVFPYPNRNYWKAIAVRLQGN
jgi:hypothetical protein